MILQSQFAHATILCLEGLRRDAKLLFLHTRNDANNDQERRDNDGPQLQLEDIGVVGRVSSRRNSDQEQDEHDIAAPAMVLPNGLGTVFASVKLGGSPHGETDDVLDQ